MACRRNQAVTVETDRPRLEYHAAGSEADSFPGSFLLQYLEEKQHMRIEPGVEQMIQTASDSGLSLASVTALRKKGEDHVDVFRASLSAGPPARIPSLYMGLADEVHRVLVKLGNCSQEQKVFLRNFVASSKKTATAF